MGWFSNLSANRKIIGRLAALEEESEAFRKASRDLRSLELEFSNLWGKVNAALGRIEKRASVAEKLHAKLEASTGPEEGDTEPSLASLSEGLTPKQLEWSRRIAAERRGYRAGPKPAASSNQ